jgi:hypothetical protein
MNCIERNTLRRIFGTAKEREGGEGERERERERERDRQRESWMWIIKRNEEFYRNFKCLALNSRHHKVPDMSEDSLQSVYLTKPNRSVR